MTFQDIADDARKYFREAATDWLETVRTDPIQHFFTGCLFVILYAAITWFA